MKNKQNIKQKYYVVGFVAYFDDLASAANELTEH